MLFGLGELSRQSQEFAAAADFYRRALEIQQHIGARLGQANTLDSMGELAEAQEQWELAVEGFAAALPIYLAIGDSYARVTARNLARARRSFAAELLSLQRLDEAETQLAAAEALDPDSPYLALRRAQLSQARGNRADAARWAAETLRRQPGWDEAQALLDWAQGQ